MRNRPASSVRVRRREGPQGGLVTTGALPWEEESGGAVRVQEDGREYPINWIRDSCQSGGGVRQLYRKAGFRMSGTRSLLSFTARTETARPFFCFLRLTDVFQDL
jgi:hypothetical protein